MIRRAKTADIPAILDLIEEAHKRSHYANDGGIDREFARIEFMRAMRFNGMHGDGACLLLVSENEGQVRGYFWGVLGRTYQVGNKQTANEVHFYIGPGADERDVLRVLTAFEDWAHKNPNVVELRIGESNILGEPDGRFAALLVRKGYTKGATVFAKKKEF